MFERFLSWVNRVILKRVRCCGCEKWSRYTVDKDSGARGYVCYSCGIVSATFADPPKESIAPLPWSSLKYMGMEIKGKEKNGDS